MSNQAFGSEICPRCEEGILVTVQTHQDITLEGSLVRIPNVQTEVCRVCGFQSLSGKEVGLFELLFAPQYSKVKDLIGALRTAGYYGVFLREDRTESVLGFGSRQYVANLAGDLKDLYLDNESSHVIKGLTAVKSGVVPVELVNHRYTVKLPKIGEGENGVVYAYQENKETVLKIAKPRPYSRDHLKEEYEVTDFFERQGVPVPRILDSDPYGSYMIKEKLAGESLAKIYHDLGGPESPRHHAVRNAVERFVNQLIDLFEKHPETKTSVSPNNIFVLISDHDCQCLLVDTGPAPLHDYSTFDFAEYWEKVIPEKIKRYQAVGYI
jgi:Phosphotransferase enzyme family